MKYSNIKISIIVPVYNVDKYLETCIESIISQTHENLEIIMVNDGSTDSSLKILNEYAIKDNRIKVINKNNEGVSTARNFGIEVSTGEYICFADADDYLMPDYIEYLLDLAVRNHAQISITKEMFTTFYPEQIKSDRQEIFTPEEALIDILSYNIPIGVYCKMFKRDFLGDSIRFIPDIFIGEGFNFNTMAFQRANKVAIGRRRIYFYRRNNPTSATTLFSLEKWKNAIYAINNIYKDLLIHTEKVETSWKYASWHTHCDAFNFLVMAKKEKEYKNEYINWKKIVKRNYKYAFLVNISLKEKIRAIIMFICPRLMPLIISFRNKKYIDND